MKRCELKITRNGLYGCLLPLMLALLCAGCGQKGGLYLPDKDKASYTLPKEK